MKTAHMIILFLVSFYSMGLNHDFHVSVCDIAYNPRSGNYEVSIRIFLDDLEIGLKKSEVQDLPDLYSPKDPALLDSLLSMYVKSKLTIKEQDHIKNLAYVGSLIEQDVRIVYFEFSPNDNATAYRFNNHLLTDVFEDQINLIHFKKGNFKQTIKLNRYDTENKLLLKK